MRRAYRFILPILATWILLAPVPLLAQSHSSLSGFVSDASGAAIPAAHVVATNVNTNSQRQVFTDQRGHYELSALPAGTYTAKVEAKGFNSAVQTNVVVNVDAQVPLNFSLAVGSSHETITVAADAAHIDTENGQVGYLVSGKQIQDIAVNGRNFVSLATLIPGSSSQLPDQPGVGLTSSASISFNGGRNNQNAWMIDGAQNRDTGAAGLLDTYPALDAINEFRVITSNYSAEYGNAGSAIISMSIKGGTNSWHGSAYEFLRNDAMDARNAFLRKKSPLKQNDFGYTVGGPIRKDKDFFFFSEEWRRIRQGSTISTHTPNSQETAGTFSSPLSSAGLPAAMQKCVNGNQIDPACFDPNAIALLRSGVFPTPNTPDEFNNFNEAPSTPTNYRQEILRVDHNFNGSVMLMGRYIHDSFDQTSPTTLWGGQAFPTINSDMLTAGNNLIVKLTKIVSPTTINELNFNVSENYLDILPRGAYQRPAGFSVPELFPGNTQNRIPSISFAGGYGGLDVSSYPWKNNQALYTWEDTLTQTVGQHTIKYGGTYQYDIKNQPAFGTTQGSFSFNGHYSGNAFADFLLGLPASYSELDRQRTGLYRFEQVEAFLQDDVKVNRHLTVNVGVRWYLIPHIYDKYNQLTTWIPSFYRQAAAPQLDSQGNIINGTGDLLNGIVQAGTNGVPRTLTHTYTDNFAPRIGFSWDPFGAGKTVIRGGYGMSYYREEGNDTYNSINNPPFSHTVTLNNPPFDNPGGGTLAPTAPADLQVFTLDYKLPTTHQYSLGLQHQFAGSTILTASYVGSHSSHQSRIININAPHATNGTDFPAALNSSAPINLYRPYPGFGNINSHVTDGSSEYNSLQLDLEKQMTRDLRLQAAYTWSKAEDNGSSLGSQAQNPYNRNAEWGLSDFDRTHVFSVNYIYALPFYNNLAGFAANALGGWEIAGITSFENGTPLNVRVTGSYRLNGQPYSYGLASRPDVTGAITYPKTVAQWFNPSIYTHPAPGMYGDSGRNTIRGPGQQRWDMSLYKSFHLNEQVAAQLRFEAFNIFNHVNYSAVSTAFGSGNFGAVTAAHDPRILQAGVHFTF